jgi:hypothetical protein
MEISKLEMVHFAQWMDDAARSIEKWAEHAPEYFKKKGRLIPDVDRFDQRAQYIRDILAAAKAEEHGSPAATPAAPNDNTEKDE